MNDDKIARPQWFLGGGVNPYRSMRDAFSLTIGFDTLATYVHDALATDHKEARDSEEKLAEQARFADLLTQELAAYRELPNKQGGAA